jgi:hypothetical protein
MHSEQPRIWPSPIATDSRAREWLPFAVALAIRLIGVWVSHGTPVVDVHTFFDWATWLDEGTNPYTVSGQAANYPPLWVFVCWVCLKISALTSLSFDFVIKSVISAIDATTVWPVQGLARAGGATDENANRAAWFYAVNPVPILIAAFHGQNDPVVIGLVAWAAWLVFAHAHRFAFEWAALLVGLSLTVKPIAVLFLPMFMWQTPNGSRCVRVLLIAALPSVVVWLPFFASDPVSVFKALTRYGGVPDFGYIGIYNSWSNLGRGSAGLPIVEDVPWQLRAAWLALIAAAWSWKRRAPIVEQLVWLVLCLYLVYGLLAAQYMIWLIPFVTASQRSRLWRVTAWTAIMLLAFYELHHPNILTGGSVSRLTRLINIPQWSGIFLIAHVFVYGHWIRWFWELATRPDAWRRVWTWFVDEVRRLSRADKE